ncbi:MAG: hypothetical protein A2293_10190 [Elusimicrobia bacterium RIFOXYB2_FULL_49_7]|nr:MAG: hypothetical protein A2293_10190 [Elusimicrobia bacterium RIFOXYB2_FULL_49_7]
MIKLSSSDISSVATYKRAPSDRKNQYVLNSIFWDNIYKIVRESSEQGKANDLKLNRYHDFFDLGILEASLLENGEADLAKLLEESSHPVSDKHLYTFSEWIELEYQRALSFDKRDHCRNEITLLDKEIAKTTADIQEKQNERQLQFSNGASSPNAKFVREPDKLIARFNALSGADDLFYEIQSIQKSINTGKFLAVEDKRALVNKTTEYHKLQEQLKSLYSELRDTTLSKELVEFGEHINSLINTVIDLEGRKQKKQEELDKIVNEAASFSPVEIEARINEVLDYFKGLMVLSSKRVKLEPCAVAAGKVLPATKSKLKKIIEEIVEFDPKVFKNDRVKYLGLPKFVIIPGLGKGLYDWKNNAVLIPTLPAGRFDESVFAGIVEYKLDMDEDKILLTSFGKLEENKGVKSLLRLKEKFIKDYTIFMGQEVKGYKVMSKDLRNWFNREVAPNRSEVRIPIEYDPISMTQDAFERLKEELQKRIDSQSATSQEFFGLSVIHAYFEEWDKSLERLKRALELNPNHLEALYNLGIVYAKKHMRKEAADAFSEYVRKSPQNWWTGVCQEHLMRLK